MAMLEVNNLSIQFGGLHAVDNFQLKIEKGELYGLIGPNGAGKTTLLRIIMQEISADSGQVVIAKDKKIGYLAQYQVIHGHHTIYE